MDIKDPVLGRTFAEQLADKTQGLSYEEARTVFLDLREKVIDRIGLLEELCDLLEERLGFRDDDIFGPVEATLDEESAARLDSANPPMGQGHYEAPVTPVSDVDDLDW